MSTIEELDRLSNERFAKEGAAVMGLVAVMRELAVGLPDGSRLAVELALHAKHLEWMASHNGPPTSDCLTASVAVMANEVRNQQLEDWGIREEVGA